MTEPMPSGPPRLACAGLTDVGRQRKHNEDHVLVEPNLGLYVVADGMGGHNAGNVASALATQSVLNFFEATRAEPASEPGADEPELSYDARRLLSAVRKANRDVFEISSTVTQHHGMGSTMVAAYVSAEEARVHVAHVGDSRCYRIRGGIIRQLTADHSLINDALLMKPDLTEDELARLPRNIITRALGMRDAVAVDIASGEIAPGDVYLLCSDGLTGMVGDAQILEIVSFSESLDEACELLIAMANEAGGTDNISAVLIRVDEPQTAAEAAPEVPRDTGAPEELAAEPEAPVTIGRTPPPPMELPSLAALGVVDLGADEPMLDEALTPIMPRAVDELSLPDLDAGIPPGPSSSEEALLAEVERLLADPPAAHEPAAHADARRAKVPTPVPLHAAFCARCGFELFEGNLFCVECGSRIDAPHAQAEAR